ncbi:alpha/beta hydrolase family protein [Gorillibacterium massiliense]|uniref:alpha/beta hydrolase family protein n=1 Tax=Gorillibacterium massiliense TaxID=1280390 RepID=UPI0004B6464E|nr:alpha/beta hydrolase [Gorillibacterium massiliense]
MVSTQTEVSNWRGYKRYDFQVSGRESILICPAESAEGKPWIWRTEFFDAFAQADMALVERGWHLAYCNFQDMYGCPEATLGMHHFQDYIESTFGLADKAALFGFSRGGLYAFNYAVRYPEKVAALYLDAPVLDIRSWPGGNGKRTGYEKEWRECLHCYGLSEEQAAYFKGNPLDHIQEVAAAGIPILLVAGDADEPVPFGENGAILTSRYRELGGEIQDILKPGVGHHPHSLEDPEPIVDFIVRHSGKRI